MVKMNSASRLYNILKVVKNTSGSTRTLAVWVQFFGLGDKDHSKQAGLVSSKLVLMSHEVDFIFEQMKEFQLSQEITSKIIPKLHEAISPLRLSQTWDHVRQQLSEDVLLALEIFSFVFPDEENQVSADDLKQILTLVNELEALLIDSKLPARLLVIIRNHIQHIQSAILEYPIIGAKSLRSAYQSAVGEFDKNRDIVEQNLKSTEISKLAIIWKKTNDIADIALKAEKLANLGTKALTYIEHLISNINN